MTFWRALRRFGGLAGLLGLVAAVLISGIWRHLSVDDLRLHHNALVAWVAERPVLALGAFVAAVTILTAACVPATGLLVVLGGALFGTLEGGAAALIGSVAGSLAVFLACRAATAGWLDARADTRVARLVATLSRRSFWGLLVLRLTPMAPLSAVNGAAGVAQIRVGPFLAASLIGSAPANFIYAGLGASLRGAQAKGGRIELSTLTDIRVIWPLLAMAALAAVTAMSNLARRR